MYKNPFNYGGAKYKLLSQILPLFPNNINTLIDLFGGSGEIAFNAKADRIIYNDKCLPLVNILQNLDRNFVEEVERIINKYGLSKENKQAFMQLKDFYNKNRDQLSSRESAVILYCLLTHSFCNQIAFNSKGEYNIAFGKRWFSPQLKAKLVSYVERKEQCNISFFSKDFVNFDIISLASTDKTFVYADPPYSITYGVYERDYFCKWSDTYDIQLLNYLSELNEKGYKWALSNAMIHKGITNERLKEWAKQYNVHYLQANYEDCYYHTKGRGNIYTEEVLVTNY